MLLNRSLPHLDRPFDYTVPPAMAHTAMPGTRVKVPFSGRDVDAYVVGRHPRSRHSGPLRALRTVVSPEPVLTPETLQLARMVAEDRAGTTADVLRLAIPPRHARAESQVPDQPDLPQLDESAGSERQRGIPHRVPACQWQLYRGGPAFLAHLDAGDAPRAVLSTVPGADGGGAGDDTSWPYLLGAAALRATATGRGCIVALPDSTDVEAMLAALERLAPGCTHPTSDPPRPAEVVRYSADLGPAKRYRAFLSALRGHARIIVGTRAAIYAPLPVVGLLVCWDDADDSHHEPRAPYPDTLAVLRARADLCGAAALIAGHARSVRAQHLLATGWAREVSAGRGAVRLRAARVVVSGEDWAVSRDPAARAARLPGVALQAARQCLAQGRPVLVGVPLTGYQPALSCARCRQPARCSACEARLGLPARGGDPTCVLCGRAHSGWHCPHCANHTWRAARVGVMRTAEELGAAFPGAVIRTSSAQHPVRSVPGQPALVLATPGSEPTAEHGYGAVLLLDTWAPLGRVGLSAAQEAVRRWFAAAALARPDGVVVMVGDPALAPVQAVVRRDAAGFAQRELSERTELGLPPAGVLAQVDGAPATVRGLQDAVRWPPQANLVQTAPDRLLVTAPLGSRSRLAAALRAGLGALSARKKPLPRVRMDADLDDSAPA